MIRVEGHCQSESGHEIVVDLHDAVVLSQADGLVELDEIVVLLSELLHERTVDLLVDFLLLSESIVDLSWEVEAKLMDSLALKHLLSLEELLSHESIEVIVEHEVLKLGQLHRENLLLDLVEDVVGLTVLKVAVHIDSLSELATDDKNELIMAVLVGEELLVTILKHLRVVLEDVVDLLVLHVDHLTILLKDELRTLDAASLVEVWEDELIIKTDESSGLEGVREKKLLSTDELDSSLINGVEGEEVLRELNSGTSWALSSLLVLIWQVVLLTHLVLHNLLGGNSINSSLIEAV